MADEPSLVKCLVWDLDNTLWQGTLLEDNEVRFSDEVRDVIQTPRFAGHPRVGCQQERLGHGLGAA